ncbi:hypothetical protein CJ030_MR0G003703 [Morella rubra]|uniref:DC1 domain-containing protein n=1 Tax=Morella rubra TaxID=262757 RepID=A0A6A1UNN1_9ROSI|nr:hypothetical protein CJ030_MR0G003703 [Morella rubra]
MEIQHFSHEHPLLYNERLQNDRTRRDCQGCLADIAGPNYSCKECKGFVLHKSCAELPQELQHPSHPKHPLILHAHGPHFIDVMAARVIYGTSVTLVFSATLTLIQNGLLYLSPKNLKVMTIH